MSALIAKEIRLLLPAYGIGLILAVAPAWLLPDDYRSLPFGIYGFFGFGTVLVALSSFGREFGQKTFPLLLAQPVARARIWWVKVAVLAFGIASLFMVWCLSSEASAYVGVGRSVLREAQAARMAGLVALVTFAGGLWTTLLLRQLVAAFWFTILVPAAITMAIGENGGTDWMIYASLGLYSAAGFLWARWQFQRAQEVAWTGGLVAFSTRRSTRAASSAIRTRRAMSALFRKELQLHQVVLAGMAGLFVLHLGIVGLRKAGHHAFGEMIRAGLDSFWLIWLTVPLLAGSLSVAEERKLGTMEGHLCLPISSRVQFAIKLLFAVGLGGIISAVLLWMAEGIGKSVRAGSGPESVGVSIFDFVALALIAFFASTLTRNILQALATAVVAIIFFGVLPTILSALVRIGGLPPWQGNLVYYIEWPVVTLTLLWLAYGNFKRLSETWRLWWRNLVGATAALVFTVACTAGIYHRAWEFLTPLEPPHGPAHLTVARPVALHIDSGRTIGVLLPDGRPWVN